MRCRRAPEECGFEKKKKYVCSMTAESKEDCDSTICLHERQPVVVELLADDGRMDDGRWDENVGIKLGMGLGKAMDGIECYVSSYCYNNAASASCPIPTTQRHSRMVKAAVA
jgi:hypothetical protein